MLISFLLLLTSVHDSFLVFLSFFCLFFQHLHLQVEDAKCVLSHRLFDHRKHCHRHFFKKHS